VAKLTVKQLMEFAKNLVLQHPEGLRHGQLWKKIIEAHPETSEGTLSANLSGLAQWFPNEIAKPSRGLFVPIDASTHEAIELPIAPPLTSITEEAFYGPFADYLKDELDEVVVVKALGGSGLQGKWGTPDVVGVYKPLAKQKIKFDLEIVTAEIKTNPAESIVAFGQAIAYRLFSSKVYLVMPTAISPKDLDRLEALAMLFGLGLVTFDMNPNEPRFSIRVRAQRFSPDMFYVNDFADRLAVHDPEAFQDLFG